MKHGAFDYVQKPFEIEEMEVKVEKALELQAACATSSTTSATSSRRSYDFERIVGSSGALQKVLGVVRKVAKSNSTVSSAAKPAPARSSSPAPSTTTRCARRATSSR